MDPFNDIEKKERQEKKQNLLDETQASENLYQQDSLDEDVIETIKRDFKMIF